ncbi:translocation and assembly module lipoprotein TamL [Persicitalea jodogahamensis]|uniref:translocation and assembly module lipoprotein TamL n=1 Tax=Persicitalea jodogahamensis TaxID=402147 RepID=UPI0035E80325
MNRGRVFSGIGFFCFVAAVWLSGCVRLSPGNEKKYLLGTTTFKGNKIIKDSEFEALIPQKPNRRFLGLPLYPYLAFYQAASVTYDSAYHHRKLDSLTLEYQRKSDSLEGNPRQLKIVQRKYARKIARTRRRLTEGNDFMRIFGEPPVYFDSLAITKNAEKLRGYLFNNGFFENEVRFTTDTAFRRIRTTYLIQENRPTRLRNVQYSISDLRVDSLVLSAKDQSTLKSSARYKGDAFEEERIRLEILLRNNGYYGFSRQSITYLINDTISAPATDSLFRQVDVFVRLEAPNGQESFKAYPVESVQFEVLPPDNSPDSLFQRDTTRFQDIRYVFTDKKFSPRILNSKMLIRPGKLYSQEDERETQRQLSLTDQFRFVNYGFDTTAQGLKSYFRAIPLDKYQVTADVGMNVIQLQQAPGPFANLSYKIRNIFHGLENFEVNLRGGVEAVTGFNDGNLYRSQEMSVNTSLLFPQLLFPGNFRYRFGRYNPRTQVGLGFNYVNRPEYARSSAKAAMTYTLQPSTTTFINLSLLDLNVLNTTRLAPEFERLLDTLQMQGNNLFNSFRRSFVSDVNFTFVRNTNLFIGPPKKASYLRVALESGGTSIGILPKQQQFIENVFGNNLQFFQYLRWNVDYRRYLPVGRRASLVARLNTGSVYSYGVNSVPPYEKYFFAGGSNSVRAWLPRRLGPGSSPPRITSANFTVEAPGELLMEGNLEYRGHLVHFFGDINYAIFLDAGNVWTLPTTTSAKTGEYAAGDFRWDKFGKQIALGTGFGLRYDLQYFVLRFDFGLKLYDPNRQEFVLDEFSWRKPFNTRQPNYLNFNLGVGYPF